MGRRRAAGRAVRRGVVAGALVLGIAGAATALVPSAAVPAERGRRCNGRAAYCDLRLDEIALPTTHNSMAAGDDEVRFPNQRRTMTRQLRDGIRAFQVDAFLGTVRRAFGRRVVLTDLTHRARGKFADVADPRVVTAASGIRARVGPPPRNARYDVYLCHNFCELGAVPMLDEAGALARFLDRHPTEVVVWVVQDELPAARLLDVLRESGLHDHLATLDPAAPLPTLGALIDSGRRLVVGLEHGDLGPEIPNVFDRGLVQEVPYRYETLGDLRAPSSCRPLRGHADAPLFQVNHWITPASRRASRDANAFELLDRRVRRCERERGRVANLVAVDFYDTGALFRVTSALNATR